MAAARRSAIDDAEDGGRRRDAQRERDDGHGREAGVSARSRIPNRASRSRIVTPGLPSPTIVPNQPASAKATAVRRSLGDGGSSGLRTNPTNPITLTNPTNLTNPYNLSDLLPRSSTFRSLPWKKIAMAAPAAAFVYLSYLYLSLPDVRVLATRNPANHRVHRAAARESRAGGKAAGA